MKSYITKKSNRLGAEVGTMGYSDDLLRLLALTILTIAILLATANWAWTQENQNVMRLSLEQARELALQKNFNIQISALDTESSFANLVGSYGIYNFTLSENLSYNKATERGITSFRGSATNYQSLNSTLTRRLFTGADISTGLSVRRSGSNSITSSLNPQFNNGWSINVTQPILKNFGKLATERQIMINSNSVKVNEATFENQVTTTLVDLEGRYWDLVSAYDGLHVAQDALQLAKEQLDINKIKVEVGTLPEIEITAAEERVAAREAELVDAQAMLDRAQDSLKQAIVTEDWDITITPTDTMHEPTSTKIDFEKSLKLAYDKRPELRQLELQMKNNDISISYARNQLLPQVNVTADIQLYSFGGTFTPNQFAPEAPEGLPLSFMSTLRDVFSGTNRDWTIGANFVYTFGNDAARSTLMTNSVMRRQNQLRIEQTRYSIAVDVRNAIRELDNSTQQIAARRKALVYAEKQLEAEQQKFQVGSTTNFQVLQYQNNLVQARYNVIVALVRHTKAEIDLERATGNLLSSRNVVVETTADGISGARMR
jgi:outer membrane protein TolC